MTPEEIVLMRERPTLAERMRVWKEAKAAALARMPKGSYEHLDALAYVHLDGKVTLGTVAELLTMAGAYLHREDDASKLIIRLGEALHEQAELARDHAALVERTTWRPIADAPKDGTEVLGHEDGHCVVMTWQTAEYRWVECRSLDSRTVHPTHFLPLPAPPEAGR